MTEPINENAKNIHENIFPFTQRLEEINRVDERHFQEALNNLAREAESMRLNYMTQHRTREFIAMNFSILMMVIGTIISGFYFFFYLDFMRMAACLMIAVIPCIMSQIWARLPLATYKREHKAVFMPKLAKALHGLTYHPSRGINEKILSRLGVLPAYKLYHAEDCFYGQYKGTKVIFSEARLYAKTSRRSKIMFQGLFVLLETPSDVIEGHTIITADAKLVKTSAGTRWSNMKKVMVSISNAQWDIFEVFSTRPDSAELMLGERLFKELAETSSVFGNSPLTAVLFGKKYIFLMIPHNKDMFEASDISAPVATQEYAKSCQKEISQIIEIIDVFDLFKPLKKSSPTP